MSKLKPLAIISGTSHANTAHKTWVTMKSISNRKGQTTMFTSKGDLGILIGSPMRSRFAVTNSSQDISHGEIDNMVIL